MGASAPVLGYYDKPMWQGFIEGRFDVQQCRTCNSLRYPPGPTCPHCGGLDFDWRNIVGEAGEIISWVVFHRQYFDDFPPPHVVVAVKLDAGPVVVSSLADRHPEAELTGQRARFEVVKHQGRAQHMARLMDAPAPASLGHPAQSK